MVENVKPAPILLVVSIQFFRNFRKDISEEVQERLNNLFEFEEIEIKKNRITFKNGQAILQLRIYDEILEIHIISRDRGTTYNEILKIINLIAVNNDEKCTVLKYEIGNLVKYNNAIEVNSFFTNSKESEFIGEITQATMNLNTIYKGKKVNYYISFEREGFLSISQRTPVVSKIGELKMEFEKVDAFLIERIGALMKSRNFSDLKK